MPKILIIEDDIHVATSVRDALEFEHHHVEIIDNGEDALKRLGTSVYDLIILDLTLPKVHGLEICRTYRAGGGKAPILMLTASDSLPNKESGFDAGADDYLTKPFHVREVCLRVQALLRRAPALLEGILVHRNIELDPNNYRATRDGKPVHLAPTEFALLEFLLRHRGQIFTSDQLLLSVWPSESERLPETIRTCIRKLRAKLDQPGEPSIIENVYGVGYRLGH